MTIRNFVIKKNPLSRIKFFAITEILAVIAIIVIEAFVEFTNKSLNEDILQYILFEIFEVGIILLITLINFIIQVYLWSKSSYKIENNKIINISSTKSNEMEISTDLRLIPQIGFFGRYFDYGNIIFLRQGVEIFKLVDIIEPAQNYTLLSEIINPKLGRDFLDNLFTLNINELILGGESQYIEYKATLGWDIKRGITSKEIQKSVLKTLAAFMNSNGGILLIGVGDNKEVHGLDYDIKCLKRKDLDGFENFLSILFSDEIGAENFGNISIKFEKYKDKDLCIIRVKPSKKPVYVRNGHGEEFFVRAGNSTRSLSVKAVTEYIESHFKSK